MMMTMIKGQCTVLGYGNATAIAVPTVNTLEVDCDAQCVVTMYVYHCVRWLGAQLL